MSTDSVSKTSTQPDERALVVSAKQQAKRLLRLAKKAPLEVSALSQALELVSQMHGYPTWQALSKSTGQPSAPERLPAQEGLGGPLRDWGFSTAPEGHVDRLAENIRRWTQDSSASVNVITPHFEALKALPGMEKVRFVPVADLVRFNPFVVPLGSKSMLPLYRYMLESLLVAAFGSRPMWSSYSNVMRQALVQFFDKGFEPKVYTGGVIDHALMPKMDLDSKTTWIQLRDQCIQEGRLDAAQAFHLQSLPVLSDFINYLHHTEIKHEEDPRWVKETVHLLASWLKKGPELDLLSPDGVVVFEVAPQNLDWELSPANQWIMAAYWGYTRRLPNAVASGRKSLPKQAYSAPQEDLLWVRSMPSPVRTTVLDWYESQVPTLILDVWDELDGPLRSSAVENFSQTIYSANRSFEGDSTQVATWLGYRPENTASGYSFALEESRFFKNFASG